MTYYTSIVIIILVSLVVLSILILENNRVPESKKRAFIATTIIIAIATIAECLGVQISMNPNIPSHLLYFVKAIDYIFTPMICGSLILLIHHEKLWRIIYGSLFGANFIFQVLSAIFGWMIKVDEYNHYTHGKLYTVYMIFYLYLLIVLAVNLLIYGRTFKKQNRLSLYAIVVLIFLGIGLQEILGSEYRVAYLAIILGISYLYIHYTEFALLEMDQEISDQKVKISIDPLTGIYSYYAYKDSIKEFDENIPENFVVFEIDINGLKAVNDSFGHDAGDEIIRGAAECIHATVGKYGKSFRIGGDEFVVLTTFTDDEVVEAIEELHKKTKAWTGEKVKNLSVSVGYAFAKNFKDYSVEDLAREADKEMYVQKNAYYRQSGIDRRKI